MNFTKQVLLGIVAMLCFTMLYCDKSTNPTSSELSPSVAWEKWEMTGYGNIYDGIATMIVSKGQDGTVRIDSLSFSNPPAVMTVSTKSIAWQKPHAVITVTGTIVSGTNTTTYTFVATGDFGAASTATGTYSLDFPSTGPIDDEGDWSGLRVSGTGVFKDTQSTQPVPVTGVTVKQSTSVNIGQKEQLIATVSPSTATNKTVTWSSANGSVATVSATGLVNGISAGSSVLTVKAVDGNFTAQCVVTVTNSVIETGTVTDIDDNVYKTVKIGNQEWTVENLRTTKYNDGTTITKITDSAAWNKIYSNKLSTPAYCYYNNTTNTDSIKKFGALYNWYAVDTKKLAPTGWHVPTDSEWTVLEKYMVIHGYNFDGTTDTSTDNKIAKSMASKLEWDTAYSLDGVLLPLPVGSIGNDLSTNNRSGFSALPGGHCYIDGIYRNVGTHAFWWSATAEHEISAYYCQLYFDISTFIRRYDIKNIGCSVRLIRD